MLDELRRLIATHARPDLRTPIDGLLLSSVTNAPPDYSLAEPLLVVMAQGGKRLLLGDQVFEYRAGQLLLVTAALPLTGHYLDVTPDHPALAVGMVLRPMTIAALLLEAPPDRTTTVPPAIATAYAPPDLLDAMTRMLRLLDHPADRPVLAPMIEKEILWRLLTGPHGPTVRQIGLADSGLTHVSRAIQWIRDNYAEPMRVADLAHLAGMSPSAFHRHFKAVIALSPLQYQKRIRLQAARTLLRATPGNVARIGHQVGYDSPSQFTREYRRLFHTPPTQDKPQPPPPTYHKSKATSRNRPSAASKQQRKRASAASKSIRSWSRPNPTHLPAQGARTVGVWGGRPPEDTTSEPVRAFREHSSPELVGVVEALSQRTNRTSRLLSLAAAWPTTLSGQQPEQAAYHTMPRLRPDQVEALIADYRAGATVYELAAQFGINRKTVSRHLHQAQVSMRMTGLNDQQIEEARTLYEAGRPLQQIGERLQVDARTVHRRLRERGVRLRDAHGRDR